MLIEFGMFTIRDRVIRYWTPKLQRTETQGPKWRDVNVSTKISYTYLDIFIRMSKRR